MSETENVENPSEETPNVDGESRMCSSTVSYKDRQGPCQRMGKYQDIDGVRWWCGLHNPDRRAKAKLADDRDDSAPVVDREVLVGLRDADTDEMIQVMEAAQKAFIEISNTSIVNWPDNTPVEKYKIIMTHMAGLAKEAGQSLAEKIIQFRS